MKTMIIFIIRLYQRLLSPILPDSCRFYPSCSEYMIQNIRKKGFLRGFIKGLHRILKCHPFNPGGYDPVK